MGHSNGIISFPVNQYDVQVTLGTSANDWGTLCRTNTIKRLSPYKPIRDDLNGKSHKIADLTDSDFIDRNMGFVFPTFSGTSLATIIKGIVTNSNAWSTTPSASDENTRGSIGNGWVYNMPTASLGHVFRITDFGGYNHTYGDSYESTTFEVLDGTSSIIKTSNNDYSSYTAKFFVKMSPYHPKNFRSLNGMAIAIAFVRSSLSGTVYYYVGGNSGTGNSAITQNGMGVSECDIIVPSALFSKVIYNLTNGQTIDVGICAVGFLASMNFRGYHNIDSSASGYHSADSINGLIPLPGLGYDTITWHPASNLCYLEFTGSGSIIEPKTTSTTIKLISVVNRYTSVASYVIHSGMIRYTYEIVNPTNNQTTYTWNSYSSFPSGIDVDVSTTTAGQPRNVAFTDDISVSFNLPNRDYAVQGHRVHVKIMYKNGVNPSASDTNDYSECGNFWILIDTPDRAV